jgi:hypothetical protein
MSAQELADLLEAVQAFSTIPAGGWRAEPLGDGLRLAEAQRGTLEAFNNLSQQSQVYASQTTLQQLLSSPVIKTRLRRPG